MNDVNIIEAIEELSLLADYRANPEGYVAYEQVFEAGDAKLTITIIARKGADGAPDTEAGREVCRRAHAWLDELVVRAQSGERWTTPEHLRLAQDPSVRKLLPFAFPIPTPK